MSVCRSGRRMGNIIGPRRVRRGATPLLNCLQGMVRPLQSRTFHSCGYLQKTCRKKDMEEGGGQVGREKRISVRERYERLMGNYYYDDYYVL